MKQPYHHGDLRRALLDATLGLIEERGVEGFTLREVARGAGVSHNAPYHHFADRAALMAAVAEDSYELLRRAMATAARGPGPAFERLRALGLAYVRFALRNPERFRLMNRPELRSSAGMTAVEAAGMRAEQPLRELIAEEQAAGALPGGDMEHVLLATWSAVHGLATLIVDGPLKHRVRSKRHAEEWAGAVRRADRRHGGGAAAAAERPVAAATGFGPHAARPPQTKGVPMTSREMLDRAVALFNAHDWDALARLWSDDAEIRVPGGAQLRGGRDWADYNRALIGAFSDARVEVDHAIIEGNAVVQLSRMIGTHRGVFHGPRGIEAAPTGRVTVVPYAEIFWIAGDRITAVHLYLDFADVLHQMRRG